MVLSHKDIHAITDKIISLGEAFDTGINHLYPYQKSFASRVIESVLLNDGEMMLAEWARQSGKSSVLGAIVPPMMIVLPELGKSPEFGDTTLGRFSIGIKIGIFAPANFQASNLYKKMRRNVTSKAFTDFAADFGIALESSNLAGLELSNYSIVNVQSASSVAKIESSTFDLIIVDEAQDVEASIVRKSIHPMLAARSGSIVKIGSPKADISDCDFYDAIVENRENKNVYFRVTAEVVERCNPLYKRFLVKERERIGAHSDEYRMSYDLVWPTEKGMFITEDQLYGLHEWQGRGIIGTHGWSKEKRVGIQVAGIDWAKNLGDTVVSVGDILVDTRYEVEGEVFCNVNLIGMLLMHGEDYVSQTNQILDFLEYYNVKELYVDATSGSVGDPLYDTLSSEPRLLGTNVVGYSFTTPNKSALYKHFQAEVMTGRFKIPGSTNARKTTLYSEMVKQFLGLRKRHTANGHLVVSKNPKKKNAKDDIADSCALMLSASKHWLMSSVDIETENFLVHTGKQYGTVSSSVRKPGTYLDRIRRFVR